MLENRPDCIHFGAAGHVLGTQATLRGRVHGLRAEPAAPRMADQAPRARRAAERRAGPPRCRRTPVRPGRGTRDGSAARHWKTSARSPPICVVDATGRGTRLPVWLEQWGYGRPTEDTVEVGIGYATHQVRIPDGLIKEKVVVAGACHDQPLGARHVRATRTATVGPHDVRHRESRSTAELLRKCATLADRILPAHISARGTLGTNRSGTWRSTSTRPAGGGATTRWTAFRPASSRSATRW